MTDFSVNSNVLELTQKLEQLRHDAGGDLAELLVLQDEEAGGLLQSPGVVQVGETEHLHDILHGETVDGRPPDLSFHGLQVVEIRQLQEAGKVGFQNLGSDFTLVEIANESLDHLVAVVELELLLVLLLHLDRQHGLQGRGLGSEDITMTREPPVLLTGDGEVGEDSFLQTHLLHSTGWVGGSHGMISK